MFQKSGCCSRIADDYVFSGSVDVVSINETSGLHMKMGIDSVGGGR